MNILVTGGSGFIGKNIVEQLSSKYKIVAPGHKELDLLDSEKVREYLLRNNIKTIVHAATKPGHRNANNLSCLVYANNRMFFNLARNTGLYRKIIFLGSGGAYDSSNYEPKMSETYFDRHVPEDEPGFSKYVCSKYIQKADNIVDLRIFGIFGKYEDYAIRFISNAICKTLFDIPITCRQDRIFDYLFIDDLMPILEFFIENDAKEKAYNITPDKSVSLADIANNVLRISGKDLPILIANEGFGTEYSGNNNRLKNEMTSVSFTPIDKAIRQLYDWYSVNRHLIKKDLLMVDK